MNLRELNQEQLTEESLINLAYGILTENKKPLAFKDIITAIENLNARSTKEMQASLNQFYTDVNIDGRFMILAENRWGLREWYAIDQVEEEIAPTVKVRKKKAKAVEEDEEVEVEEIELVDDFDSYDDEDEDEDDDLVGLDIVDPDAVDADEDEVELELEIDLDDEDLDDEDLDDEDEDEDDKKK